MFEFFKSKLFLKNLAAALVVVSVLFFLLFKWLDVYTLHGKTISVPDFSNLKMEDIDGFIKDKNLTYQIIDSVYDAKKPKGVIVKQDPEPGTQVKSNRKIYLYVTSASPPMVTMPKLEDKSLRQALAVLETYGLRMGRIKYIPDQCANCILQQLHKGKKVTAGTMLEKNSFIDLVVGKGLGDEEIAVPYLIGLSRDEAVEKLAEAGFSAGSVRYDSKKDSLKAKVYRQNPKSSEKELVKVGSSVDFLLTTDASKIIIQQDTSSTATDEPK